MKKALYFILLAAEAVVGLLSLSLMKNNLSWIPCLITAAVWAALLVWQIGRLKKAGDESQKRKARRNIALVMLTPTVATFLAAVWLIVGLSMVI